MTVIRNSVGEEANFSVKFDDSMYAVLSKLIYTDPVMAVVREITNNAMDAHIESGCPEKAITVQLPNALEPVFVCRDYGNGLSHTDIMTLYSTYGASTKRDRDDVVGKFGLGSKSPLAYVEQFIVVSYFGGEKRTYTAFKNEGGTPSITHMHTETSDETGLEIRLSVRQGDERKFYRAAESVFELFNPQPIIKGASISIPSVTYVADFGTAKLRNEGTGARVIVGRIAYPVNCEQFNTTERRIAYAPLDIHVNMRDLTISASREQLFYDDKTKAGIIKALNAVKDAAITEFYKGMNANCSNYLEACGYALDNITGSGAWGYLLNLNDVEFNGKKVERYISVPDHSRCCQLKEDRACYDASSSIQVYRDFKREIVAVVDDDKFVRSRIKYNFDDTTQYVALVPDEVTAQALIDALGTGRIVKASTLPDKPRKPVTRNPSASMPASVQVGMLYDTKTHFDGRKTLVDSTVDISKGGFYLVMDNYRVWHDGTRIGNTKAARMISQAVGAGYIQLRTDVLFVSKTVAKQFNKAGNWHNLFDHITEDLKGGFTKAQLTRAALDHASDTSHVPDLVRNAEKFISTHLEEFKDHPHIVRKIGVINKYKVINKDIILYNKVSLFIELFGYNSLKFNPFDYEVYSSYKDKFIKSYTKFEEKYNFLFRLLKACQSDEERLYVTRSYMKTL